MLPEPKKPSRTTSPERELFVTIASIRATGFEIGWSGDAFGRRTSNTDEQSLPPYQSASPSSPSPLCRLVAKEDRLVAVVVVGVPYNE